MPHAPCVRHSRPYASLRRLPVTRQNLCRHFPVEFPITFTKSSSNESSSCSATGISPITESRSPSTMDGNSNGTGPEHCSALPAFARIHAGYSIKFPLLSNLHPRNHGRPGTRPNRRTNHSHSFRNVHAGSITRRQCQTIHVGTGGSGYL